MTGHHPFALQTLRPANVPASELSRDIVVEVPVALEYNGIGYTTLMATPDHFADLALGHAVAEGLVNSSDQVEGPHAWPVDGGWIVRTTLPDAAREQIFTRARKRVSDSSCGLCGVENIAEALRPIPKSARPASPSRAALWRALADLGQHQSLNRLTGAAHAAAFCGLDGQIVMIREDVGRHSAFDKLIGACLAAQIDMTRGFALLSARCSYELVEKAVRGGVAMLVTISAPTSLAIERARAADLTLICLARPDASLLVHDPYNLFSERT